MTLRHQLPVYSPVGMQAVIAGLAATFAGDAALAELENLLIRTFSATSAILCGSGTQALQVAIALRQAHARPGAIVALPAFNCYDVASAAIGAGARVLLYDIDAATLTPDLASFERCLEAGAQIAVVASLYGIPIPWQPIAALASRHDATLIEDAAQGHGAAWNGEAAWHIRRHFDHQLRPRKGLDGWRWRCGAPPWKCHGHSSAARIRERRRRKEFHEAFRAGSARAPSAVWIATRRPRTSPR